MLKVIKVVPAAIIAGVLVLAGLWAWQAAGDWVLDWSVSRPEFALWAVRSAAIAAISAAQVILLGLVGAGLFGRGPVDSALTFSAGAICALASVSAVACGVAGR